MVVGPKWPLVMLGDVADIRAGQTPKGLETVPGGHIPFYKVGDMNSAEAGRMGPARTYLDETSVRRFRLDLWPAGTVVFPKQGGAIATNKKRVLEGPAACDLNTMGVVASDNVLPGFLRWWFETIELTSLSNGSVVAQIGRPAVQRLMLPLPSLDDQRAIVAAIEEVMSRLEAAVAGLSDSFARLNQLRRAAYHDAMVGRWPTVLLQQLTPPERPICYGILKPKVNADGVVPYIEVKDITRGSIDETRIHLTSPELHEEYRRSTVRSGDVVIAIRGSYGRCAVVPTALDGANLSRDVARVSPGPEVSAEYLALALESPDAATFFRSRVRGVGVQGINLGDLRVLPVPLPPRDEQERLVGRAASWLEAENRLRTELVKAKRRARSLKSSVLAAAFAGSLSTADAELQTAVIVGDDEVEDATDGGQP